MTGTGSVNWILEDAASGVKVEVTGTMDAAGKITLSYTLLSGTADLNGLFIDYGNDGGMITQIGSKANNMNGSDNQGDKLHGFDDAAVLGTVGGNDADNTSGTVHFQAPEGLTLQQLAMAEIGIRATSVGEFREGSLKLADTGTYCPPDEPADFPTWGQDISHVTLVFDQDAGDTKPKSDGDGYYTVKIDNWPEDANDDLDASIDDILAWLVENDTFVTADSDLMGVIIKGGQEDTNFYAYGDYNTNGTAPDDMPAGIGLSLPPADDPETNVNEAAGNETPANAIDATYDYDFLFV